MDDMIASALQRWPKVPDVHGWLSLDARGVWRIHEGGDAEHGSPGQPISHRRIIEFINRNYASTGTGQWYFQNGPQRVFVHIRAAPYVLRLASDPTRLEMHTGTPVNDVSAWLLSSSGSLYAATPTGGAIVLDRDLPDVLQGLCSQAGSLFEALAYSSYFERTDPVWNCRSLGLPAELSVRGFGLMPAPVRCVQDQEIPALLGFLRHSTDRGNPS